MRKKCKYFILAVVMLLFFDSVYISVAAVGKDENRFEENKESSIEIEAPHGVLIELSTGKILFEKDANTPVAPASVTKIMTMLLIFEALEDGKIQLKDSVTVSEKAASMGGSQVFFEPNEVQTVDTMLKCIAIASANDACVAMAEHLAGTEEQFVQQMNERAKTLGMKNTNFVNCNGLDAEGHKISAYDVALMSRELLSKHPQIHDYCTVWMEDIVHTTKKGSSSFGLANTNKLIRQYEYCTGLKTGSTGAAGFCVSASAKKDGMELVAVIMNGETSKSRFEDAKHLLNYGFENFRIYRDTDQERMPLSDIKIKAGMKDFLTPVYEKEFVYLLENEESSEEIVRRPEVPKELNAPIEKGAVVGKLVYYLKEKKLGEINILAGENVEKALYWDVVKRVWLAWLM